MMNSTRCCRLLALPLLLGTLAACSAPTTTAASSAAVVPSITTAAPSVASSVALSPAPSAAPSIAPSPSAVSSPSTAPSPSAAAATDEAIPSTQIIEAYEADQAAADATYQGKRLLIRGNVTNINDVFGTQALLLRNSEDQVGLQCYLTNNADAAKVQLGQDVTVEGVVRGGELSFFMVVDECVVH